MFGQSSSKKSRQEKAIEAELSAAERAAQSQADNGRAWHKLADLYWKAGQSSKAQQTYLHAAAVYREKHEDSKAMALYSHVLKLYSTAHAVWSELAACYLAQEKESEAADCFRKQGEAYQKAGHFGSAIDALLKSLAIKPTQSSLWLSLSKLYVARHDRKEAISVLEEGLFHAESIKDWGGCQELASALLQLSPEHLGAFRLAAHASLCQEQAKPALSWLQQAFRVHPKDIPLLEMMAEGFSMIGQPTKSIKVLHQLADLCSTDGEADTARQYHERILELDPEDERAKRSLLNLSSIEFEWGASGDAWDAFEEAEENASFHTDDVIDALHLDPQSLAQDMEVIALPSYIDVEELPQWLSQVEVYLKYDLYAQAETLLERLLQSAPNDLSCQELQVKLRIKQDRPDDAAAQLLQLAGQAPTAAVAVQYLEQINDLEGLSREVKGYARSILLNRRRDLAQEEKV